MGTINAVWECKACISAGTTLNFGGTVVARWPLSGRMGGMGRGETPEESAVAQRVCWRIVDMYGTSRSYVRDSVYLYDLCSALPPGLGTRARDQLARVRRQGRAPNEKIEGALISNLLY